MLHRRLSLLLIAFAIVQSAAYAHVLDEYLQSTLVVIEPGDIRLRLNLTPGSEIADKVLIQIDPNRDGVITSEEAAAYIQMLQRDLTVRLDGRPVALKLAKSRVPEPADLRTGHGIIQIEFEVQSGAFDAGPHKLAFENRHVSSLGAYLFNAARPKSGSVQISRQNRNTNQSRGEIEFTFEPHLP